MDFYAEEIEHETYSRDPRDVVVSFVYFIIDKYPYHPLYEYLSKGAKDQPTKVLEKVMGISRA